MKKVKEKPEDIELEKWTVKREWRDYKYNKFLKITLEKCTGDKGQTLYIAGADLSDPDLVKITKTLSLNQGNPGDVGALWRSFSKQVEEWLVKNAPSIDALPMKKTGQVIRGTYVPKEIPQRSNLNA